MSFNKITIVGYLGRDPDMRYTPQGTAVCKMSVATTEKRKNAAGQTDEHTTWFRVTVWGRQAELAKEYLVRGRQVYIEGRLRLEEYKDREGNNRISPEVTATDVQFLGHRTEQPQTEQVAEQVVEASGQAETQIEESSPIEQAEAPKPVEKKKSPVAKRNGAKELVSIEEDSIPF